MSNEKSHLGTALKGMAMGMAEVVPGVSGGTIAFITGIYERLINSIKSFDGQFFKHLFGLRLKSAFQHVDGLFVVCLMLGMMMGILTAIFSVSYLLEHYPPAVWAFFFGLIVASAIYVLRQVERWNFVNVLIVLASTAIAFYIVKSMPSEGSTSYLYTFFAGTIAICALMLPGISGSFILLLMGMYKYITGTLKNLIVDFSMDKVFVMLVFGLGCLTGLAGFSRVLSWTFKHYKSQTLAALSGFMIGSLWKIWPWRIPVSWMDEAGKIMNSATNNFPSLSDEIKILAEQNVMPSEYVLGPNLLLYSIASAVFGFVLVFLIDKFGQSNATRA